MRRRSILFFPLVASLLILGTPDAGFGQPDPANSTVPNVVYSPGGSMVYTVNVKDGGGFPLAFVTVALDFSASADSAVCWCTGQTHPIISAITNISGDADFIIDAGGCIDPSMNPAQYVVVTAASVPLDTVGAVSPDAVDVNGLYPWQGWNPGGLCRAGLGDMVSHTEGWKLATYSFCTDMNSDGVVDLSDAVLGSIPINAGEFCN